MRSAGSLLWMLLFLTSFLFLHTANVLAAPDDEIPEITARVARIGFLRGEAQIKRAGESDWERAAQNLPVVEGDEITTGKDARLEIQFDSRNFLRLAENSYLKITTLKDEGIAVSLSQGNLSVGVLQFDKEARFFEIDAPQTTVAVQKAGTYRIDAGDNRKSEVRVTVSREGEARLYSENSGFLLRGGRSARVFLEGNLAGEWETSDASAYVDDFDKWTAERDSTIARRLQNAGYDKYHDRDIYGAEDLNDNGEWIYTKKYGYVWRPFPSAVSSYADWSPYRYGHWRWVPPYGWTWVGDEPWGWATYHHGRWVYDGGNWYWTPYGQNRLGRSRWRPALVVINYIGNTICWYPLGYNQNYYNYNSTYIDRRRTTIINNTTVVVNPTPTPTPVVAGDATNLRFKRQPPVRDVPPTGVVAVDASEFGRRTGGFRKLPPEIAERVLSKTPVETDNAPPLPTFKDLNGKVDREILVENPVAGRIRPQPRTGAGERKSGVSLDENLRTERIYGNRPPVEQTPPDEVRDDSGGAERRRTGAIKRLPRAEIVQPNGSSETPEINVDNSPARARGEKNENRDRRQQPPTVVFSPEEKRRERRQSPPDVETPREMPRRERREKPPERYSPPAEQPQKSREPRPPQPQREDKPAPREEQRPPPQPERERAPSRKERPEPVEKDNN
ncbi:MAG TPA: DUF6600 domain-containing protein [Pyrinomonadaceae bacterium]|nr:DUF6600 domain-containing protein [Pyrinomonadaceae bacterium]